MNLILIGNDTDSIALDIWKGNTNYMVLNKDPQIFSKQYALFTKNKEVIVSTTAAQFETKPINNVIETFKKLNFIPIFISKGEKDIVNNMYAVMKDEIPSSVLYIKNKANKDYDELIKIARGYLLGKGIIENGDKTIRTPRKRKTTTSKK